MYRLFVKIFFVGVYIFGCSSLAVLAQRSFNTQVLNNYPAQTEFCQALDYDQDGDVDLVAFEHSTMLRVKDREYVPSIVLLENTPEKNFPKRRICFVNYINNISGFEVIDLNKDNRLDFIITLKQLNNDKNDGGVVFLLQQADGTFFEQKIVEHYDVDRSIVADLDQNGYVDVVTYQYKRYKIQPSKDSIINEIGVFLGSKDGYQFIALIHPDREVEALNEADIDDDGDVDLIYFSEQSFNILLNQGPGKFELKYGLKIETGCSSMDNDIQVLDVNKDGKKDILFVMFNDASREHQLFYLDANLDYKLKPFPVDRDLKNDGFRSNLLCADLNRDGLMDVIYYELWLGKIVAFIQGQKEVFRFVEIHEGFLQTKVLVADINNDGEQDIIGYDGRFHHTTWLENINFKFYPHNIGMLMPELSWSKPLDFDNDGDNDVLTAQNGATWPIQWFENKGKGQFQNWSVPFKYPKIEHLALMKIDKDQKQDIVTSLIDKGKLVWLANKGLAQDWPMEVIDSNLFEIQSIQTEILDKDERQDIIITCAKKKQVLAYLNKGEGKFNKIIIADSVYKPQHLETGDFNGDGQVDVLVVSKDSTCPLVMYKAVGKNQFIRQPLLENTFIRDINVLDWNKDKQPDIVVLGHIREGDNIRNYSYKSVVFVLLNQGGKFERINLLERKDRLSAIRVLDIDQDQDWDIFIAYFYQKTELLLNQGDNRSFLPAQEKEFPMNRNAYSFGKIYVADFNKDNKEELCYGFADSGWMFIGVFSQ